MNEKPPEKSKTKDSMLCWLCAYCTETSDQGGKAEVAQSCATYGGSFCIYPWYTLGKSGFHYGVDYPDTQKDFGQASQFTQAQQCGGPFGPNTTFCSTILK